MDAAAMGKWTTQKVSAAASKCNKFIGVYVSKQQGLQPCSLIDVLNGPQYKPRTKTAFSFLVSLDIGMVATPAIAP